MPNVSIYEKITQKGTEDAERILEEGGREAKAALDAAVQEAQDRLEALMRKTAEKNANLVKTRLTEFEQAGKQELLLVKKTFLDQVQTEALSLMKAFSDAEWKTFVLQTIASDDLAGNETIVASGADRKRFVSLFASAPQDHGPVALDLLNKALKGKKYALVLSEALAPVDGGFFVVGTDFDVDHSYGALLSALKDKHESELAAILFDGE